MTDPISAQQAQEKQAQAAKQRIEKEHKIWLEEKRIRDMGARLRMISSRLRPMAGFNLIDAEAPEKAADHIDAQAARIEDLEGLLRASGGEMYTLETAEANLAVDLSQANATIKALMEALDEIAEMYSDPRIPARIARDALAAAKETT